MDNVEESHVIVCVFSWETAPSAGHSWVHRASHVFYHVLLRHITQIWFQLIILNQCIQEFIAKRTTQCSLNIYLGLQLTIDSSTNQTLCCVARDGSRKCARRVALCLSDVLSVEWPVNSSKHHNQLTVTLILVQPTNKHSLWAFNPPQVCCYFSVSSE